MIRINFIENHYIYQNHSIKTIIYLETLNDNLVVQI